jgi:hypothetical protein
MRENGFTCKPTAKLTFIRHERVNILSDVPDRYNLSHLLNLKTKDF